MSFFVKLLRLVEADIFRVASKTWSRHWPFNESK